MAHSVIAWETIIAVLYGSVLLGRAFTTRQSMNVVTVIDAARTRKKPPKYTRIWTRSNDLAF